MSFHKARYICIRNLLLSKTLFCKLVSESAIRKPEYSTPELLVLSYSFLANFSAWSYFIEVCIFSIITQVLWNTYVQKIAISLPSKVKVGHQGILTQEQDLVQFLSWERSPMIGGSQAPNRKEPLNICGAWGRRKVATSNAQKSFPGIISRCCLLLVSFPEPAKSQSTLFSVTSYQKPEALVFLQRQP